MNAFLIAWRSARFLPVSVVRATAWLLAMAAWAARSKAALRLERNLSLVTGLSGRPLRALSRRGLASAGRYYAEVLELPRMTEAVVDARVRLVGFDAVEPVLVGERATVVVLSHSGNWDLVGAYACRHIVKVTSVAEVLEPREVFDEFVGFRESLGMQILGHEGAGTFRRLLKIAKSERTLVCLVADRDLSGSGIEVEMWGRRARVAPGPAALAQAAQTMLVPVMVHYERLHGARRRAARSRWGVVMSFGDTLDPRDFTGRDRVNAMSQAWATSLSDLVSEHPEDWHMLQRFGWVEA